MKFYKNQAPSCVKTAVLRRVQFGLRHDQDLGLHWQLPGMDLLCTRYMTKQHRIRTKLCMPQRHQPPGYGESVSAILEGFRDHHLPKSQTVQQDTIRQSKSFTVSLVTAVHPKKRFKSIQMTNLAPSHRPQRAKDVVRTMGLKAPCVCDGSEEHCSTDLSVEEWFDDRVKRTTWRQISQTSSRALLKWKLDEGPRRSTSRTCPTTFSCCKEALHGPSKSDFPHEQLLQKY